jgi:hypothetical protein
LAFLDSQAFIAPKPRAEADVENLCMTGEFPVESTTQEFFLREIPCESAGSEKSPGLRTLFRLFPILQKVEFALHFFSQHQRYLKSCGIGSSE